MSSITTSTSTPTVLSEHPVSESVRARIMDQLRELEQRHQVRVLFACESGSRGWGFASPDSDYDVRFVYVHQPAWYLRVDAGRDVIELPIDDELDINGWELRKALQLMKRSNPTLLEWLQSPLVYVEDAAVMPRFRALAQTAYSPWRAHQHYVSMARKNFAGHLEKDVVRLKKYLYVLRPLLAARWIREVGQGIPPMRFAELAEATLQSPELVGELNRLLAMKMRSGEAAAGSPWPELHAFIAQEMSLAMAAPMGQTPEHELSALDAFLNDVVLRSPDSLAQ